MLSLFYNSTGILLYGSFPHDFGYRYKGLFLIDINDYEVIFEDFTKSKLDNIFLEICSQENAMPIVSTIAKIALSLFGFIGWRSNRKKNYQPHIDYSKYY